MSLAGGAAGDWSVARRGTQWPALQITRSKLSAARVPLQCRSTILLHEPHLTEQEGVIEGDFLEIVVAAACAAVARLHICYQQQKIVIGLYCAEFRYVLGRFPIHYLAVVEAGLD